MPQTDSDTHLAIDTLVDLGLLSTAGLKRFAELVRSLKGFTTPMAAGRRPGRPAKNGAVKASAVGKGRKRRRGRLEITKDALRAAYATKSAAQIAAEHGVTPSAVQQRLSRWKIKKPSGGVGAEVKAAAPVASKGTTRGSVAPSADELRRAYATKTVAEIAKEHGVSAGAIQMRLKRMGIKKPGGKKG